MNRLVFRCPDFISDCLFRLQELKYVMEVAPIKTLANKYKTSVACIYGKYHGTRTVDGYADKILQGEVPIKKGTRCSYWGVVPLKTVKPDKEAIFDRIPVRSSWQNAELIHSAPPMWFTAASEKGRRQISRV